MISANELGGSKRTRLSKKNFESVKQGLEDYVLTHFPQLKQQKLQGVDSSVEKYSLKAGEMKRRTGELPNRDEVRDIIVLAMDVTTSMDEFSKFLAEQGFDFYTRGKNFGVKVEQENGQTKSYRFSTMGIHDDFADYHARISQQYNPESHTEGQGGENDKFIPEPFEKRSKPSESRSDAQKNSNVAGEKEKPNSEKRTRKSKSENSALDIKQQKISKDQKQEESTPMKNQTNEVDDLEREFQDMTNKKSSSQRQGKKQSE
jgi:hypothetical protein